MPSNANEDIVQKIIGNFGRWQLRTIILVFLCKIPTAWFMACIIYTAPLPHKADYYCKPSAVENTTKLLEPWIQRSYPTVWDQRKTDRQFDMHHCFIHRKSSYSIHQNGFNYTNPFARPLHIDPYEQIIPCDNFEHISEYKSLITQFDLVCSRELLVSVTQSFHAVGALFGSLLAVKILKHVSPKRLMLYGMIGQIICGNMTGLVSQFMLHVYYRCLTSMFCAFMYTSGQVIMSDITFGKARIIVITLSELFSSIGLILLPGISIFFDSWSYLYVAISSSLLLLVLPHRWIADSPRWLLKHHKIEKTLKLLLEAATVNYQEIPLDLEPQLQNMCQNLRNKSIPRYWSIWDGKTPRIFITAIHWAWAFSVVIHSVMIVMIRFLNVEQLHVNTSCLGFAEMLGIFLGLYFILYTRHRWLWSGYMMIFAGCLTFLVWLNPNTTKEQHRVAYEMIFWLFLKLINSASLAILSACSGELVAPEKVPILMTSVSSFSRFWLSLGPFILILIKVHHLLPLTIFATMALITGILMCILNIRFCNYEQPKVGKIPTPNTYRRNSSTILSRKLSLLDTNSTDCSSFDQSHDNPSMSISIEEFWESEKNEEWGEANMETTELGHSIRRHKKFFL